MDRHSFREHMRKVHYKKTDLIYFEDSKGNRIKQPWVEEVCYQMEITEKLIKWEKYMRKQKIGLYIKKNMVYHFHNIFVKEMWNTETGKKWRKKLEK